jgi:hypothetical protein
VEREFNVPGEVARTISRDALGELDSTLASTSTRGRTQGGPIQQIPDHLKVTNVLSAKYDSSIARMGQRLNKGAPPTLELPVREDSIRTFGMYNRLLAETGVDSSQVRVINPEDSVKASD